jgi:hypothetical protein
LVWVPLDEAVAGLTRFLLAVPKSESTTARPTPVSLAGAAARVPAIVRASELVSSAEIAAELLALVERRARATDQVGLDLVFAEWEWSPTKEFASDGRE